MTNDLIKAKAALLTGDYTCVVCKDAQKHTSTLRGVKPLVAWVKQGMDFSNFSAADKVVGKATAFLYSLLKVKSVYAKVISQSALYVLTERNIEVYYDTLVEHIINRQQNGICPFEKAVLSIDDEQAAYFVILSKMQELGI